jgi:cardiolipin synthase
VNHAKPLPATSFEILPGGKYKFPRMLEDMARAERFIHLQYFIWYQDQPSRDITDVLLDRLKAGVEVRIMNDYIGNIAYKKDHMKELQAAGAIYDADIKDLGRANYRNHRKFVIIDGDLGYTGGINVGQEYIDGMRDGVQRFPSWRDTHVRYEGQAVAELSKLFAERWYEVREEDLFKEEYFPAPAKPGEEGTILTQLVAHGVSDPWESARRAHMVGIAEANHHVYIQTPYFVPDVGLYDTMVNAALSGVDLQMMMPGPHIDKGFPFWAAESYFRPLLEAGGRIFLYQDGFFHSKTLTIDAEVFSVGTLNLDIRALKLHKELMLWVYDKEITREHEDIFLADRELCKEVTLEEVLGWTAGRKFRNSAARLYSNVL